jgi:hypothetical protein
LHAFFAILSGSKSALLSLFFDNHIDYKICLIFACFATLKPKWHETAQKYKKQKECSIICALEFDFASKDVWPFLIL